MTSQQQPTPTPVGNPHPVNCRVITPNGQYCGQPIIGGVWCRIHHPEPEICQDISKRVGQQVATPPPDWNTIPEGTPIVTTEQLHEVLGKTQGLKNDWDFVEPPGDDSEPREQLHNEKQSGTANDEQSERERLRDAYAAGYMHGSTVTEAYGSDQERAHRLRMAKYFAANMYPDDQE